MKTFKWILILIALLGLVTIGYWFGGKLDMDRLERMFTERELVTVYDTTYVIKSDTLIIRKSDVKTYYYNDIDTIFVTKEFEKSIDTTIDQSRLQVSYYFPQDSFRLRLHLATKEILRTDSIKVYIPKVEYKTDYKTPIFTGTLGIGLGIVVGAIFAH